MVPVYLHVVECCAAIAAFACWGVAAFIGRQLVRGSNLESMIERFRLAARWVARAAVMTAIASLAEAAEALTAIVRSAGS